MDLKLRWDANIPAALRLGHDELRAEVVRATMEPGAVGEAAKRLAELCLPHFEAEERTVFPVFGLLDELATGEVTPEMAKILSRVSLFSARHHTMAQQHRSITSAAAALMRAAHRDQNWPCAEFAYHLRVHERMEDEVIYPALILIGKYVRQALGIGACRSRAEAACQKRNRAVTLRLESD